MRFFFPTCVYKRAPLIFMRFRGFWREKWRKNTPSDEPCWWKTLATRQNSKFANRTPILRGIEYFVFAHVLKAHKFWVFCPNLAIFRWPKTVKRHIYTSRHIIWAYNQVYMTVGSKVLARKRNRWRTDRRTSQDGHPNTIDPRLWDWRLKSKWVDNN